ncbi:MAG: N-acetylmuramoyl-L-alanine amidase [Victivallaceae bacterium]
MKRAFSILLTGALLLPFAALSLNGPIRGINTDDGRYLRIDDIAGKLELGIETENAEKMIIGNEDYRFELGVDKRTAKLDGMLLYFNFPVLRDAGGNWYMHRLDFTKTMQPFFLPEETPFAPIRRILLDPGHGGSDTGAKGAKLLEKDVNLEIARRVAKRLREMDFSVFMTREDDRDLSLDERAAMTTGCNADLFISIHQNAALNREARGIETFAIAPSNAPVTNGKVSDRVKSSDPGNRFERDSLVFAAQLQQNVLGETGAVDRGVKHARFRVLRFSDTPSVLIECGFISNAEDEAQMTSDAYLDKLAAGIARAVYESSYWADEPLQEEDESTDEN